MSFDEMYEQLADAPKGYGSGLHYPYCRHSLCTGCIPADFDPRIKFSSTPNEFDLSIFRKD